MCFDRLAEQEIARKRTPSPDQSPRLLAHPITYSGPTSISYLIGDKNRLGHRKVHHRHEGRGHELNCLLRAPVKFPRVGN